MYCRSLLLRYHFCGKLTDIVFFFNRKTETLTFVPNISMVADNCHSSKRHKFVNFRLNFNYFELKLK